MKKIVFVLCVLIAISLVISCGNKTVEIDKGSDKSVEQAEDKQEPRELQEAEQQPLLWVTYQEFLNIQKDIPASQSLTDNNQIQEMWKTIEQERVSWKENPSPGLTSASIEDMYRTFVDVYPLHTQFAINALLYNGAPFDVINELHQLKDNEQAFVDKFNELLR